MWMLAEIVGARGAAAMIRMSAYAVVGDGADMIAKGSGEGM